MTNASQHLANRRTSVADALKSENRYWGARFCDTSLVTPWKLLWTTAKVRQYTTTARIFPGKNPDTQIEWDDYRINQKKDGFGDWIRWHWAWRRAGFGDPITFLIHPQQELDQQCPAQLLYKTVKYAVDHNKGDRPGWGAMISNRSGVGAIIGKPKRMFMVQCAIFEHAGVWFDIPKGLGEDDLPCVLDLGSDAAKGVIKICRERWKPSELEEYMTRRGIEPLSFIDHFKYGDPIGLHAGKFFEFYPEVVPPPHVLKAQRVNRPQAPAGPLKLSPAAMRQRAFRDEDDDEDEGRAVKGYSVNCYDDVGPDEHNRYWPELDQFADVLEEKVRPWSEVLIFPTYQEQAELILPLLRLPSDSHPNGVPMLDTVFAAWGDHKDWLPSKDSDLMSEWLARETVQGADVGERAPAPQRGPALHRRPPAVREDEAFARPATPPVEQGPEDNEDAPPRRLTPRQAPRALDDEDTITERPTGVPAADKFRQIQEDEMAARAQGETPNFPTPGMYDEGTHAPAAREGNSSWRQRMAGRRGIAPTPGPAAAHAQAAVPGAGTDRTPSIEGEDGFTPPPTGGASMVRQRLAAMQAAARKIPPKA